ncbi:efflux RND transporter periplasmic adaptor subunit [Aliiroseovarius sp.]|uniref:efflux RND transporter periplasmic adaptor subunit n=1 Tax=Aliiroseovarius sp. TaxID=1872442 RepID=UPI0026042598|nr:efflux RND transporter periplasmic adaptor subunit [Aliiroseovarius sp.]
MRLPLPATLNAALLAALIPALTAVSAVSAQADETHPLHEVTVTEWKAVFGQIETRDLVPARARLGGTLDVVSISEGDRVEMGQPIGTISDRKLTLQLNAVDAQLAALQAQLENAQAELKRGEDLVERGVSTVQRLDALRTQVDVLTNQIEATRAERSVIEQQAADGTVLAPLSGVVLDVPVTTGAVIMPGEPVAMIGGGGFFLRLAVPERHAGFLREGAEILIGENGATRTGRLAKLYPQIQHGRVTADVEVEGLSEAFTGARVLVRLPVGEHAALLVHEDAVLTRMGLDFVAVEEDGRVTERAVVLGEPQDIEGEALIEVVSGLKPGDTIVQDYQPATNAGASDHE